MVYVTFLRQNIGQTRSGWWKKRDGGLKSWRRNARTTVRSSSKRRSGARRRRKNLSWASQRRKTRRKAGVASNEPLSSTNEWRGRRTPRDNLLSWVATDWYQ